MENLASNLNDGRSRIVTARSGLQHLKPHTCSCYVNLLLRCFLPPDADSCKSTLARAFSLITEGIARACAGAQGCHLIGVLATNMHGGFDACAEVLLPVSRTLSHEHYSHYSYSPYSLTATGSRCGEWF